MTKINNKGVTAVEYGLIGALISIVIMGGVALTGVDTKEVFCVVASGMETALGGEGSDCSGSGSQKTTTPTETPEEIIANTNVALAYIPKVLNLGGSGEPLHASNVDDQYMSIILENSIQVMEDINADDPITGVWGLYDSSKTPITTYDDYMTYMDDAFSHQTSNGTWGYNNSGFGSPYYEVTTESGKVYGIQRLSMSNGYMYGIDIDTKQTVYSATNTK